MNSVTVEAPAAAERPAVPAARAPASQPAPRSWWSRLSPFDALLPLAVGLWALGVHGTDTAAMTDYGLLPGLPPAFFAGLGLFTVSCVAALARSQPSRLRLGLHLVWLVVLLHGVAPLVFSQPEYAWVYKHIGVVQYIALHGSVDGSIDIYQNWPGFFALAAWFDRIAGAGSPIEYAAWAPVYFNLLAVLALGFALRGLPADPRQRWLALFLFVAGNWVGQDYFAPQAFAFVLCLIVIGVLLRWFRRPPGRRPAWLPVGRWLRSKAHAEPPGPEMAPWPRIGLLVVLNVIFAAVVVSHQLSPFIAIAAMGVLVLAGLIGPRWLLIGPIALAVGYLLLHLGYVEQYHSLLPSLNPFANAQNNRVAVGQGQPGLQFSAGAARALAIGIWSLAAIGAWRLLRQGRGVLAPLALMVAPVALLLAQDYGGEAIYRVYLFSLPWAAFLAAAAVIPAGRWAGRHVAGAGVLLAGALALFVPASFGVAEVYMVPGGEVEASQYLYAHAPPGSIVVQATPNFPSQVGAGYDHVVMPGGSAGPILTDSARFRHRTLGASDIPAIESVGLRYGVQHPSGNVYLVLSGQQQRYAETYGVLPHGSLDNLDHAVAASRDWRVVYQNQDAVIYQLVAPSGETS